MSMFGLMWSNLFRKRTRTILTLFSVTIAFMLFMLLRGIADSFTGGNFNLVGIDRLMVAPKYSIVDPLPVSQEQQIENVPGVDAASHGNWFGGQYVDPKNFFAKYPVVPQEHFDMFPELLIEPDQLDAFIRTRTGAVASEGLAKKFGWQVGDVIPIKGDIYAQDDGTRLWQFELVGTFGYPEGEPAQNLFLFNYQYFAEAVEDWAKDTVGWWSVRLSEPERAGEIARQIDSLFENSQNPTRTATEDEYSRQFAKQLGDIGLITTMIMGAVFFTIILLTANTMTQALRERIPELAVLKTIGFTDTKVSLLVLGEALLLCIAGGVAGIGLAFGMLSVVGETLASILGQFDYSAANVAAALGLAVVIGLVIGAVPAITARRLTIVDALRQG
jgi:putative ABC transport system permease protein